MGDLEKLKQELRIDPVEDNQIRMEVWNMMASALLRRSFILTGMAEFAGLPPRDILQLLQFVDGEYAAPIIQAAAEKALAQGSTVVLEMLERCGFNHTEDKA